MKPSSSSSSSSKKRGRKKKKPKPKPSSPFPPQSQSLAVSADPLHQPPSVRLADDEEEKKRALDVEWLMDAFSSLSFDQISSAYVESGHDPFKAAGILGSHLVVPDEEVVVVSSVRKEKRRVKRKGVAVASGMVADVIGKGYWKPSKLSSSLLSSSNCGSSGGGEGRVVVGELEEEEGEKKYSVEEGEEFLCSMLGDDADLGMGVVKDVLCEFYQFSSLLVLLNFDLVLFLALLAALLYGMWKG